jgi:hypothetical protein
VIALTRASTHTAHAANEALVALAGSEAGGESNALIAKHALRALASKDYGTSSEVARALGRAPDWLALAALDDLEARLDEDTPGITLLTALAKRMRERVLVAIQRAFAAGGTTARMAELAVNDLAPPFPDWLVRSLLAAVARRESTAAGTLIRIAPKLEKDAHRALAIEMLVPALKKAKKLRDVASIGGTLGALAPQSGAGVRELMARFERDADIESHLGSWYDLGDLARAIGAVSDPANAAAASALLSAALDRSAAKVRANQSSGLDLQRALKEGLKRLGASTATKKKTLADRIDAAHAREEKKVRARKLAPIPKARVQRPPPELRVPDAGQKKALAEAIARGRALASVEKRLTASSTPDRIASAVDAAVTAMRLTRKHEPRAAGDLASLYGDALVRAAKWRWRIWADGAHVTFAVVSPRDTHAVLPIESVLRQLRPSAEVTLLLAFRMIVGGDLGAKGTRGPIVLG